ncbi:MAG: thermonuclease family protein, partial [Elusimicrobia bacterium]|nr:thermonuclease family protein [Elusimicrobiota bacterium]
YPAPAGAPGELAPAEEADRKRIATLLAALSSSEDSIQVDGIGAVTAKAALGELKRVVLLDELELAHAGMGPDGATASIYLGRGFASQAGDRQLTGLLARQLLELGARAAVRAAGGAWTPELAQAASSAAAKRADRVYGRLATYARVLSSGLRQDFEDLGLAPEKVHEDFLADEPQEQQAILNRLAALRAKGFSPEELTPQLAARQKNLDAVLLPLSGDKSQPAAAAGLRGLREKDPKAFGRLTAGFFSPLAAETLPVDAEEGADEAPAGAEAKGKKEARAPSGLDRLLAGEAPAHPLRVDAHSSAEGLAWRIRAALTRGRDVSAMLDGIGERRLVEAVWRSWDDPARASVVPVAEKLVAVRANLAARLEEVRSKAAPEAATREQEQRKVERLIRQQPLVRTWSEVGVLEKGHARVARALLKDLPPVRGKSPEMQDLREEKQGLRDASKRLQEAAEAAQARVDVFARRAELLTKVSMAAREWLHDSKGLSAGGDFLWDQGGRRLELLVVVAGADSPRPLRREALREIAELSAFEGLEVTGYEVGEAWLKQAYTDVDRNVLVSRFSLLGLTLYGPDLGQFFGKLPERELYAAALDQAERSRAALAEGDVDAGQTHARLAVSLTTALGLKLHGFSLPARLPGWEALVERDGKIAQRLDGKGRPQYLEQWLAEQHAALGEALASLRDAAGYQDLASRLRARLEAQRHHLRPGQVGGLLLGAATARPDAEHRRNIHELSHADVQRWLKSLAEERPGWPVPKEQERVTALLHQVQGGGKFWEWYPQELTVGEFGPVGSTAFGRPVEVRVRVRELPARPEAVGLIARAAPSPGALADRYDVFLNGAIFQMEPEAREIALRVLLRQLEWAMDGAPLDRAREAAVAELELKRARDDMSDREVLAAAVSAYNQGVRVDALADAATPPEDARAWRGRRREGADELVRLAQGVVDFLKAPQRQQGARILLAYASEERKEAAERMAEVFAGNGVRADIVAEPAVPGALHHAMRQGAYRLGFLVTGDGVLPFGHFQGDLPQEETLEILAAESAVKRVRRLAYPVARVAGLVGDRFEVQRAYLGSLRERFSGQTVRRSDVSLLVDTDQAEVPALLKSLGLTDKMSAVDVQGSIDGLARLVAAAPPGERRLGVSFNRDGLRLQVLDVDGSPVKPSDLSLIFSWYLVEKRGHRGRLFRAFTQTRLLDRLAAKFGLQVEEVDPTLWGVADADSVAVSPWTPYNDRLSQALLAAEIVAAEGKSLGALLAEIRGELGEPLHYEKAAVPSSRVGTEQMAEHVSPEALETFLTSFLKEEVGRVKTRKSVRGIQVRWSGSESQARGEYRDWLYLRRTRTGFELYAEGPSPERVQSLLRGGRAYLRKVEGDAGPSRDVLISLALMTAAVLVIGGMFFLPVLDPVTAFGTPIIGTIYAFVGRVVELGFGALEWLFPNFLRSLDLRWNNPWVLATSVLMVLEFLWYWGVRAGIYYSGWSRTPGGRLAKEIDRLPILPKISRAESTDWFTVAPLKDGHLAVLKPAFARLPTWVQPLAYAYQAHTVIKNQAFDDRNSLFRGGINARAWLFLKVIFVEPRILAATWVSLFAAAFPNAAASIGRARAGARTRLVGLLPVSLAARLPERLRSRLLRRAPGQAAPGLPVHMAPPVGIPLPAELRGRYRSEYVRISRVSDGDTVETFDGRWIRYKGMNASDVKRGQPYKLAKEFNSKAVRGKEAILLIPQVSLGDHKEDEYELYEGRGRILAYVYVKEPSGRWVNVNKEMLRRGLADTSKGSPDPIVPDYLETDLPLPRRDSPLKHDPAAESAAAPEALPADRLVPDAVAREALKARGARVDEKAELLLDDSFAGPDGKRLSFRLGQGARLAAGSQLFVSGAGVRVRDDLVIEAGGRLNLQAPPAAGEMGRILIGSKVRVEGRLRATVSPGSILRVLSGTRIVGDVSLTVPPGRQMSVRVGEDGQLSVQTRYRHPRFALRELWKAWRAGQPLTSLEGVLAAQPVSAATLGGLWRAVPGQVYQRVVLPASLTKVKKSVTKLDGSALEGRHGDAVAAEVARERRWLAGSVAARRRYLLRREGLDYRPKQAVHVGLERHYEVLALRQQDNIRGLVDEARLDERLAKLELGPAQRRRLIAALISEDGNGEPEEEEEEGGKGGKAAALTWEALAEKLPKTTSEAVAQIRREVEALVALRKKGALELEAALTRAQENLASFAAALAMGPRRIPDAASVVLGGAALFAERPDAMELLVVRRGAEGPRLADPARLAGLGLDGLGALSVVTVGEDWLGQNPSDGLRNRLLTRFLLTGATLWGKDIALMRPENLGGKVPLANQLSLAAELIDEAEARLKDAGAGRGREQALLAHFLILAAAPGLVERLPDGLSDKELLQQARRQWERVQKHWESEGLRLAVARGAQRGAREWQADGGVGGMLLLDARTADDGKKPVFETSSEEAWAWIEGASAPPESRLPDAQRRVDAVLERLRARGDWTAWQPERLEVDRFVVVGRDGRGRAVEVRLRVARAEPAGVLSLLAKSNEGRRMSDVDRYALFLNASVLEMDPGVQELVLDASIQQLGLALQGQPLRSARDQVSQKIGLTAKVKGATAGPALLLAMADHARGRRVTELPFTSAIPWEESSWVGPAGADDARRLAQGLADFVRGGSASQRRVLIGYASPAERPAATAAAETLAANGVVVDLFAQETPLDSTVASAARAGPAELGLWIGADETRVVGKDGGPLETGAANELGNAVLRSRYVRSLPGELAAAQGLLHDAQAPPEPGLPAPEPAAEERTAPAARVSQALFRAFPFQLLLVGLVLTTLVSSMVAPAFFASLPWVHVIFGMIRAMSMFKSSLLITTPWVMGLILLTVVTLLRYVWYGRIGHSMAKGEHTFRGLAPELEDLPRVSGQTKRSGDWLPWSPVRALPDGRIGIREENFTRRPRTVQLLMYVYAAGHTRFYEHPAMRFILNMAQKLVIGRFKVARVFFFIVTEPFVLLLELSMLTTAMANWALGRPLGLVYRVRPRSAQGIPLVPSAVDRAFHSEWVMVTSVLSEDSLILEDGRIVRVIGAGKTGKGVSLATLEARKLLQGKEIYIFSDRQREDTRRLGAHIYIVETDPGGKRRLVHGLKSLVAKHPGRYGGAAPNSLKVDESRLPLSIRLQANPPIGWTAEGEAPSDRLGPWEKLFTVAVLGGLLVAGGAGALFLLQAALSPLAHGMAVALGLALVPAGYGLWRVFRGGFPRLVLGHRFLSASLAAVMAFSSLSMYWGGPTGAVARRLNDAVLTTMEYGRFLPDSDRLGYSGAVDPGLGAASLPSDHFLTAQARALHSRGAAAATWTRVELPGPIAANYWGMWAFVTKVGDGDTYELSNGHTLRPLGINAPETEHGPGFHAKEGAQPLGPEAREFAAERIEKRRVLILVPKVRPMDSYGRVLSQVYYPDAQTGRLQYLNAEILEAKFANDRYGEPDPLLRGVKGADGRYRGPYRTLDPATLRPAGPSPALEEALPAQVLELNPLQVRSYVEERATFQRFRDAQTLEVIDSEGKAQVVRLWAVDVKPEKAAEALTLASGALKPGERLVLFKGKHYDTPGQPFQLTAERFLKAYVYVPSAGAGSYWNLNAFLADESRGLSGPNEGLPDVVFPPSARPKRETMDFGRLAWEAAQRPLRQLGPVDPELAGAYAFRVATLTPSRARRFEAAAAALGHYSQMEMVAADRRGALLSMLVRAHDQGDLDAWIVEKLVPALRASLMEQRIPPPQGSSWDKASWSDVLLWASAGKLGAVPDRVHFPTAQQVAVVRDFLAQQKVPDADPAAFLEGVLYGRLQVRMPSNLRRLGPESWLDWTSGAFWAPAEAAQIHRSLLYDEALSAKARQSPVTTTLLAMAYSHPEAAQQLFSDARDIVGITHALALEALKTPELAPAVRQQLQGLVPDARREDVLKRLNEGQAAAAIRLLSPAETFMLGRRLADDPNLVRYLLASHQQLKAELGRLKLRGVGEAELKAELDALLALPGGASLAEQPMIPAEDALKTSWEMHRRLHAEILVQLLVAMHKDGVPARFVPMLLPHAAELVLKDGAKLAGGDWPSLTAAVRKITPAMVHGAIYQSMGQGIRPGYAPEAGLLDRDLGTLLDKDFAASAQVERYDNLALVGDLGFPEIFESDLQSFKSGTFRVDPKDDSGYKAWKKGNLIKIMVGKSGARRGLFVTRIESIERKRIGDLTLEDLRAEFPATRFLTIWKTDEELRQQLIGELIEGLSRFYEGVTIDSQGYFIRFESFPEVQHKN